MPKETIRNDDGNEIVVGWAAGCPQVQIASQFQHDAAMLAFEENQSFTSVRALSDLPRTPFGLWVNLDRREDVNALIRHLRHARDKAFGADE